VLEGEGDGATHFVDAIGCSDGFPPSIRLARVRASRRREDRRGGGAPRFGDPRRPTRSAGSGRPHGNGLEKGASTAGRRVQGILAARAARCAASMVRWAAFAGRPPMGGWSSHHRPRASPSEGPAARQGRREVMEGSLQGSNTRRRRRREASLRQGGRRGTPRGPTGSATLRGGASHAGGATSGKRVPTREEGAARPRPFATLPDYEADRRKGSKRILLLPEGRLGGRERGRLRDEEERHVRSWRKRIFERCDDS